MTVAITIHARHRQIGSRLREHIHERVERLLRSDQSIAAIDVEISAERDHDGQGQRADLTALTHGRTLRAQASARDAWHAVDRAAKRMDAQLRRERQRRLGKRLLSRRLTRTARP